MTSGSVRVNFLYCHSLTAALPAVALACVLGVSLTPAAVAAQDDPAATVLDDPIADQPEPSRDEWRQRIEDARLRAKAVARERQEHPEYYAPIPEDPDVVASERVLRDDSLRQGDIVTTKKGTFVFRGRSDQPRSAQDFLPVAPPASR